MFTKSMEDVVAEEFGETTLEVEVSLDCGEVQWMRHGLVIQAGPKFTLKQIDRKRSLTIHKLALSDRGTYSCETLHDRAQAKLSVEREYTRARSPSHCALLLFVNRGCQRCRCLDLTGGFFCLFVCFFFKQIRSESE